jgi:hypothetical protein
MKKEKLKYISLIDIHPSPTPREVVLGKHLEFPVSTRPPIKKKFNHYYLGNDGKVYKIDRYMLYGKKQLAKMMLQKQEKIGYSETMDLRDLKYGIAQPSNTAHLTSLYEILGLVHTDKIDKRMRVYDALELPGDSLEVFKTNKQLTEIVEKLGIDDMEEQYEKKHMKRQKKCLLSLLEAAEYRS